MWVNFVHQLGWDIFPVKYWCDTKTRYAYNVQIFLVIKLALQTKLYCYSGFMVKH